MLKILHTSDVHIGKAFEQFGAFGQKLRAQIKGTLARVFQLAAERRVDAVLLSGDVFDSERISQADIKFFMDIVNSIQPTPVFFLPGTWTHDSIHQKAIFRSPHFQVSKPENLQIFTKETAETTKLASGRLAIHGRAVLPDSDNPLEGLTPDSRADLNILLLHTGIALPQIPEESRGSLLKREQVERCGFTYLAMGDRHTFTHCFDDGKTFVQYPGSPETLQFKDGEDSGFVALVTLGESGVSVEKIRTGHYKWTELDLPWEKVGSIEALRKKVDSVADPTRVLRVKLAGTISNDESVDAVRLAEELAPRFAYFEIDTHVLQYETPLEALQRDYRERTVEHAFVSLLRAELEATADAEAKRRLGEVLRRGHALFQGIEEVTE
ncbi:MAG TPA: DNA repair exonuclease [Terriglobia bacterium]|nr:DNA repair exonuclease [Terriglobia bacterium]